MTLAAQSFAAAVNHLLAREPWARKQLEPYAGKTAQLAVPALSVALRVRDDGLLEALTPSVPAAPPDASAVVPDPMLFDVTITASADALPAFVQGGQAAAMKHVRIAGDAEFATTIARLSEHLRWEPEEDLAAVLGDAPAHQLAQSARTAAGYARRTGRNLLESLVEYFIDEDPQLVHRSALAQMGDELVTLRDALARLEKRLDRLDRKSAERGTSHPPSSRPRTPASAADAAAHSGLPQIDSDADAASPAPRSDRSR